MYTIKKSSNSLTFSCFMLKVDNNLHVYKSPETCYSLQCTNPITTNMNTLTLLFLNFQAAYTAAVNPFLPGPYEVDFTSIDPELFGELDHHLDVFTPRHAGTFPVIIFFPGMSCTVSASSYSTILQQVASWGYVVLGPWAIFYNPIDTYKAKWVDHIIHWSKENFNTQDMKTSMGIHPALWMDFDSLYLGAQSSGSHVAVEWLKQSHDCSSVKAMFLMSPVDGVDPFGLINDYCIHPPTLLNFQTPTMIISGGLDSIPGMDNLGSLMPACAPEDLANDRFYDALTGPSVLINTTDYGHIDCLDDDMLDMLESIHFCKTNLNSDKGAYRTFVAGQITAFLKFVGEGDCSMGSLLEEVTREGIKATVESKGGIQGTCGGAGCAWQGGPFAHIRL